MLQIDLNHVSSARLLDEAAPKDLALAVEGLQTWTPRSLALVDDVLAGWVADFIARPNDREGLISLQSAILRILRSRASEAAAMHESQEKSAADFARRWEAFTDALAARDITLAERDPDRVRKLKHVAKIEALVRKAGEIEQSAVQQETGLAPARLSQVLALMEAHGLIHRRSEGRGKFISLAGPVPDRVSASNRPAVGAGPEVRRGIDYLARKPVAA